MKFEIKNLLLLISIFVCFNSIYKLEKLKEDNEHLNKKLSIDLNENSNIVFVGGIKKSGLTKMKDLLNIHPLISCNEEVYILHKILEFTIKHYNSTAEMGRLLDAGIDKDTIEAATGAFLLELVKSHKKNAKILCNLYPNSLLNSDLLSKFIPNTKFILILDEKESIKKLEYDQYSISQGSIQRSHFNCLKLGPKYCITIFYDMLRLDPEGETKKLFSFLNIPWIKDILKFF